jgi:hypothetical protein
MWASSSKPASLRTISPPLGIATTYVHTNLTKFRELFNYVEN